MRYRHEPPIDTLDDMARSQQPWGNTHIAWLYSIVDSMDPTLVTVRENYRVLSRETLEVLSTKGTMAFAIEHLDYNYFVYGDFITIQTMNLMRPMRGNIFADRIVSATVRCWYLKDELDEYMMRVVQAGLPSFWLLDVAYRLQNPSVQIAMKVANNQHGQDSEDTAEPLRIERMTGIFYLWVLGMLMSIAAFVGELLSCK